MKPPFFLIYKESENIKNINEFLVYSSIRELLKEPEPVDVLAGGYQVFDANGDELILSVVNFRVSGMFGGYRIKRVIVTNIINRSQGKHLIFCLLKEKLRAITELNFPASNLDEILPLLQQFELRSGRIEV